jgi:hypothetical protein
MMIGNSVALEMVTSPLIVVSRAVARYAVRVYDRHLGVVGVFNESVAVYFSTAASIS